MTKLLELINIKKIFDNGIIANKNINMNINKGEIHAIVGENGAGKSTLMNIVFGEFKPTEGEIILRGKKVEFNSPKQAIENGIGMVHQHFKLVDSLSIAQNIYLGIEPKKNGIIDRKKMIEDAGELATKYNFTINPNSLVKNISVGEKQKVEILKALARGAEILILDEPTAVLTPQETEELFDELITFKEKGHSIIFISHKLKEVKYISDRVTVIRRGETIGTYNSAEVTESSLSNLMVGREVVRKFNKKPLIKGQKILEVNNLNYVNEFGKKVIDNITFHLNSGKILGIAGIEGNGQSELVSCITGMFKNYSGDIKIQGQNIKNSNIRDIRNLSVAHIPEDRLSDGIALEAKISENLIATKLHDDKTINNLIINQNAVNALSDRLVKDYYIHTDSINTLVKTLSGGNMQKVVIAREMSSDPKLLIVNQPTRGVDIGASEFIYQKILDMRDNDIAILMVSSDLNEILELSDSIMVFYNGKIVAYFEDSTELDEVELGYYMLGIKQMDSVGGEKGAT